MNQSDIRGLVCRQQARADIDILRREHFAFLKARVQSATDGPIT